MALESYVFSLIVSLDELCFLNDSIMVLRVTFVVVSFVIFVWVKFNLSVK